MVNLSLYDTVFCDSLQALEWAYRNGLPKSATIKTSAPAVLWNKKENIFNIEGKWNADLQKIFQSEIAELTKDIFDSSLSVAGVDREIALTISLSAYHFQKIIYKASCLDESDFTDRRLFIYVDGKTGPSGNMMNSPWDELLSSSSFFSTIKYTLESDKWETLTTQGISYWKRFRIAGYETIIYRLALKLMNWIPDWAFTKEVLVPNENELNIEVLSALALQGVKISNLQLGSSSGSKDALLDIDIKLLYDAILPIMRKRVECWVDPCAVDVVMLLFKNNLDKKLTEFSLLAEKWNKAFKNNDKIKSKKAVLVNSPGNTTYHALAYICRKRKVPLISSQHGVTVEMSKAHDMLHVELDNSVADIMFSYNSKIISIEKNTYFNKSKHHIVGMPMRLIRMKDTKVTNNSVPLITYISNNFYHGGFNMAKITDYSKAKFEHNLITKVLRKLPYQVCYKTYPFDNRRYADEDPVLNTVKISNNIELFSEKVDMRYLISSKSVLVTTCATSTLGWLVMSGRPVVFINQKNNRPLTDDAYLSISKGLFVFNDGESFYKELKDFLSQPINVIEEKWKDKEIFRREMLKDYFSAYKGGAGKRAAKIILENYL